MGKDKKEEICVSVGLTAEQQKPTQQCYTTRTANNYTPVFKKGCITELTVANCCWLLCLYDLAPQKSP